jgi:hypothetical protein
MAGIHPGSATSVGRGAEHARVNVAARVRTTWPTRRRASTWPGMLGSAEAGAAHQPSIPATVTKDKVPCAFAEATPPVRVGPPIPVSPANCCRDNVPGRTRRRWISGRPAARRSQPAALGFAGGLAGLALVFVRWLWCIGEAAVIGLCGARPGLGAALLRILLAHPGLTRVVGGDGVVASAMSTAYPLRWIASTSIRRQRLTGSARDRATPPA